MRRSASEIIRNLEQRISQLEKQASNWDDEENYHSPQQKALRVLADKYRSKVEGFSLLTHRNGSVSWENVNTTSLEDPDTYLAVYVSYDSDKLRFVFDDGIGKVVYGYVPMPVWNQRMFLSGSKRILTKVKFFY